MNENQTHLYKTRVLVVDHDLCTREGLAYLLEKNDTTEIVGKTANASETITLLKQTQPDVICLEINLPDLDGVEAIKKIKHSLPDAEILIITTCNNHLILSKALRAGAKGCITKDASYEEIKRAFNKVRCHQSYLGTNLAQKMATQHLSPKQKTIFDKLSPRELVVAKLVSQGEKTASIAAQLNIDAKTVSSFRYRIFAKLNIKNDVELAYSAIKCGIVENKYKS